MDRELRRVEPAGWGEVTPGLGAPLIRILEARAGKATIVEMADGRELIVYDGRAWGRDYGQVWDHVTARLTPLDAKPEWAWFILSDVEALLEPDARGELFRRKP